MSMSISSSGLNVSSLASNRFSKIDTKQQGFIDKGEFTSALSGSQSTSTDNFVSTDGLFEQLDGDDDGKITESELSSSLTKLADSLTSQWMQSRVHGDHSMPPPPPQCESNDAGFTKDELSAMATGGKTDSRATDLFGKLADNFAAADANGDGRITLNEAMDFDKTDSISGTTCSTSSSTQALIAGDSAKLMMQLMQLLAKYGLVQSSSTANANNVSVSA